MQISKSIFLILILVTAALVVGVSVCDTAGVAMHTRDAALAAVIGLAAAVAGLLPLQLRNDPTPVSLFQSAWIGSILHMGVAAALGMAGIYLLKLSTPFVIWLLVMYWITLIGLCVALVRIMRTAQTGTAQPTALT